MTPRHGLPEFWATSLAKMLVGNQPCYYQGWVKGHYRIEKVKRDDDSSLVEWRINHTEQLAAAVKEFKAEGWKCQVEQYFRVPGKLATLAGKVDLVTQKGEQRPVIRDIKSGKSQESDASQVMLYMIALPMAWRVPTVQFDGEVIYPTHSVHIPAEDAAFMKPKLTALIARLAAEERPDASPSESTCRYCDISKADCPDRWEPSAEESLLTSEW